MGWHVIEALPGAVRCGRLFGDETGALPIAAVWCSGAEIGCVRDLRRRLVFATWAAGIGQPACGQVQLPDGLLIRRVQAAVWKQDEDGAGYWETAIATARIKDGWAEVTFDKQAATSALIIEGYNMTA